MADDADKYLQRLELVLEGTRLGMWDWNPQTDEVVFDERWAEMLGHQLSEIEPTLAEWSSRVHPDDLEACYADIRAHMNGETEFYENVHRMRHKNGHWVHILDRGRISERDNLGRPVRFTGTHTNITAQREAEVRALALARGRTRFLATMSHEVRTPLHGILGLVEAVASGPLTPEQREAIGVIQRVGDGLVTLVNDILDFAKASEGALQVSREPFRLKEVVEEVSALYREKVRPGVSLVVDFDPSAQGYALGDEHRIRQMLSNLVSNAVKFTHRGLVLICVRRQRDVVEVVVRDTGPGISDTSGLFQPYDQLSPQTARVYGGTGLGLAIVKHLVELMSGSISVETKVGVGTAFLLRLPLPEVAPPALLDPCESADGTDLSHLSILIADDNAVNRMVFEGILRTNSRNLEVVADGRAAVDALGARGADFDIMLLDLFMPELDGDAALREIRARGIITPAIAVTADAMPQTRQHCEDVGFVGFLAKPFRKQDLFRVIQEVVVRV